MIVGAKYAKPYAAEISAGDYIWLLLHVPDTMKPKYISAPSMYFPMYQQLQKEGAREQVLCSP